MVYHKPTAIQIAPHWLKLYCKQFLQKLVDQGARQRRFTSTPICS